MPFVQREYLFENAANMMTTITPEVTPKKFSTITGLRRILKPILKMLKKKQQCTKKLVTEIRDNNYNTSLEDMRNDCAITEELENDANEALERKLHLQLSQCAQNSAIYTFNGSQQNLLPIEQEQTFIPVHFVRTEAGTFFWTSLEEHQTYSTTNANLSEHCQYSRWVQA